jgi:hypothetical protein
VVCAYNPSTQKAEAAGSRVQGQPGYIGKEKKKEKWREKQGGKGKKE